MTAPYHNVDREELVFQVRRIMAETMWTGADMMTENPLDHDALVLRLSKMVPSVESKPVVIQYPSSWWQHFKQDWFPKWWLWPPKLTTHTVVAYAAFYESDEVMKGKVHVLPIFVHPAALKKFGTPYVGYDLRKVKDK